MLQACWFKRAEKFRRAIAALQTAEERGQWLGRERQTAESGFSQGLVTKPPTMFWGLLAVERWTVHTVEMSLLYGKPYSGVVPRVEGVAPEAVEAWLRLCEERATLVQRLDAQRPRPMVTPVGLSPKVTKTLTEMDLDIDLSTIEAAKIVGEEVPAFNRDGTPKRNLDGSRAMTVQYRVEWQPGTALHVSRFSASGGCEACGKSIPSRRFVPIQARCRRHGVIGMWLGVDCARKIFGVKDLGIPR